MLPRCHQDDNGRWNPLRGLAMSPLLMLAAPPLQQITYSAINDELRDRLGFPALLHTPGTSHQIEVMVQLMLPFC